ncbi:MAG: T9SS type A sorting domain-containing protein, partial [Bacteroidales bacterium]|nr:T9SS type A sorting domain-containing protein [Bacteroidales bacterium]
LFGGSDDYVEDLAIQPDGKIVFVGYTDNSTKAQMIAGRLNTDGTLDNSFNANGMTVIDFGPSTDSYGLSMALLDDGKILIAGYIHEDLNSVNNIAMCRLTSSGVPDNTFGVNGLITYDFNDLWCFPDNVVVYDEKILLGGVFIDGSDFMRYVTLSRYYLDGSVDYGFGNFGYTTVQLDDTEVAGASRSGMCVTVDGKIAYATHVKPAWLAKDFAVLRFTPEGDPDNSFGNSGMVITEMAGNSYSSAIVAQNDGKIVASGAIRSPDPGSYDFVLVRYLDNGDLDASFGAAGTGVVISNVSPETWFGDESYSMMILLNGKFLVSGYAKTDHQNPDFALASYHSGLNVGIETKDNAEINFSINPNPITDQAILSFSLKEAGRVKAEVINTFGSIVASITDEYYREGEHQLRWDGSGLAAGVYIVKITVGDRVNTGKLVKTR